MDTMGPPRIWVLTGTAMGDNVQVLRAAEAMGLDFEIRNIIVKSGFESTKPRVQPSLDHVDLIRSSPLLPPWPDLVMTIGRSKSMVALWIKQQSLGKTRIALFGVPKGMATEFDLVVVPSYYRMDDSSNVLRIGLPLNAIDPIRITDAHAQFAESLGKMPKPLHVLLLGGGFSKMSFDPLLARTILNQMRASFATSGTIFVSTSRRTPSAAADIIEQMLGPNDRLYRWTPEAVGNPYPGLLAHGDSFTVTGDSVSMITEVARLGKPLAIAELPFFSANRNWLSFERLKRWLIGKPRRSFQKLFDTLYDGGHAVRLGEPLRQPVEKPEDDTGRVAERLRKLVRLV